MTAARSPLTGEGDQVGLTQVMFSGSQTDTEDVQVMTASVTAKRNTH